jgi:uncharacterized protein (TIGR03435 family)
LLADRFQLKVRRETREGNVYALVVAKNGPKLKDPASGDQSFIRLARYDPPERPALTYVLYGQKTSMPLLAERLAEELSAPVLDRTEIKPGPGGAPSASGQAIRVRTFEAGY